MNIVTEWMISHALFLLLSAGSVFNVIWLTTFRNRLQMKMGAVLIVSILHTVFGVMAVRLFAFAEGGFDSSKAGNMSLFGGVFLMPIAYWLGAKLTKRSMKEVYDLLTICMIFTLMCARINCIIGGCCKGMLIPGQHMRWPTREAEIIFYIILLILLGKRVKRDEMCGQTYPIYMMAYGIFRFIIEGFRFHEDTSLIHPAHIWALISFGVGFSIYAELQKKNKKGMSKKK